MRDRTQVFWLWLWRGIGIKVDAVRHEDGVRVQCPLLLQEGRRMDEDAIGSHNQLALFLRDRPLDSRERIFVVDVVAAESMLTEVQSGSIFRPPDVKDDFSAPP